MLWERVLVEVRQAVLQDQQAEKHLAEWRLAQCFLDSRDTGLQPVVN